MDCAIGLFLQKLYADLIAMLRCKVRIDFDLEMWRVKIESDTQQLSDVPNVGLQNNKRVSVFNIQSKLKGSRMVLFLEGLGHDPLILCWFRSVMRPYCK